MTWVLLCALILSSAIISGSETAVFSLSRRALADFQKSSNHLQRTIATLMGNPRSVLMTVLIANTLINVTIFSISYVTLEQLRHQHHILASIAGGGILLAVVMLGEIAPKVLSLSNARVVVSASAGMIAILHTVLAPVRWLLGALFGNPITRLLAPAPTSPKPVTIDELQLLVEHSAQEGHFSSIENEMLQSIVALGDVRVREVMAPRVDIEFLRLEDHPREMLRTLKATHRRILPVCGRDLDDVRGSIYARDPFLNPQASLRSLMHPVFYVPEQIRLTHLMRNFRLNRSFFAIVVDEYGGTSGLVAIEDVLAWIVGEVSEADAEDEGRVERLDENTYRVPGDLNVRDWAETFAVPEVDRRLDTVGGLVLSRLGRLPQPGDSVQIRNLTLTVESVNRRRIQRVLLRRDSADATNDDLPTDGASH
ncbi:MAG: HlyC/CorC family transporter [Planctomycetes bacterium]|nr:HlyC/CorC family transporter [Planctomycetota bacterium]MBI3835592.1 HlyC/CorC family transporter [Planctomycetota bacterium]